MQEFSLLFPGQGAQIPGMGRDVADSSKDAMDIWKKAELAAGIAVNAAVLTPPINIHTVVCRQNALCLHCVHMVYTSF